MFPVIYYALSLFCNRAYTRGDRRRERRGDDRNV